MVNLLDLFNWSSSPSTPASPAATTAPAGGLLNFDDPNAQARLGFVMGLLQAGGPSRVPVSFGQALGNAFQTSMGAHRAEEKAQLEKTQLDMLRAQVGMAQAKQNIGFGLLGEPSTVSGGAGASAMPGAEPWRAPMLLPSDMPSGAAGGSGGTMGRGASPGLSDAEQQFLNSMTPRKMLGFQMFGVDPLKVVQYYQKGIEQKGGNYYTNPLTGQREYLPALGPNVVLDANTGQPFIPPSYIRSNAALKGAEQGAQSTAQAAVDYSDFVTKGKERQAGGVTGAQEAAKSLFTLVPDVDPVTGNTVMVPQDVAIARARRAALGGGAASPAGGPAPGMAAPGAAPAPVAPGPGGAGAAPVSAINPARLKYNETVAQKSAEGYSALQKEAAALPETLAKYQKIGELLQNYDGNPYTETGMHVAQIANSLGISIDKNLPNKEAARTLIGPLALELRSTANGAGMPGSLSDNDLKFLKSSTPSLEQSAQGRAQIVERSIALAERKMMVAEMARQWQQRYGQIDAVNPVTGKDFLSNLSEWSSRNPLFSR